MYEQQEWPALEWSADELLDGGRAAAGTTSLEDGSQRLKLVLLA